MDNQISLGLDIGVSSVGFSVLDSNSGKVLELGVRLFNASVAEENQTRRDRRSSRRLLRRQRQRRIDVGKLFSKYGLIDDFDKNNYFKNFANNLNPYELRVKGLTSKLTKIELANALYHIVKRRGISFMLEDINAEEGGGDYSNSLKVNEEQLNKQTPAQIQLNRLQKFGKVRGQIKTDNQVLLNIFPTSAYFSEAQTIIKQQKQYYPGILTSDFETEYYNILQRKRDYFVGPGNEKSRTDYGIYKTNGKTLDNLFEELIGHDKIFPNELRASNATYTAQIFNLLNDLNNLTIATYEDGKLSFEDKQKIINELTSSTKKTVSIIKLIKKITGCQDEDIRGYRLNEKDKPDINSLQIYRKVHRDFLTSDVDITNWPIEFYNELSFIITLNTEDGEIRKQIQKQLVPHYSFLDKNLIKTIINHKDSFNINTNNKWHRFSLKTMNLLIPDLLHRPIEQMSLISEMGLLKKDNNQYKTQNYLPYKQIAKNIYNPVAAKSVREALKIVNAVLKKYQTISYIVIEMPRDKNADEEKKQIEQFQKDNKKEKDAALETFKNDINDNQKLEQTLKHRKKLYTEIRLWYQQEKRCLYSGKYIDANDLLNSPELFDIDHIIPQSISFDDSINNKTLCYTEMNRNKDQKTPFEFMNDGGGQGWDKFKALISSDTKLNNAKKKNLLLDENVSDIEVRKRFITRNLVDTTYSSRVVLNSLQEFFGEKQQSTKVTVIRGKFTSNMRKHWRLQKSRETYYHHAVDASIIAATPFLNIWKKGASMFPKKVQENFIDIDTGEIISENQFDDNFYQPPFLNFDEQLRTIDSQVKFSHQVDKKMNRRVSNDTIYSVRQAQLPKDKAKEEYIVAKVSDIYTVEGYTKFKKIYDKDPQKFLLAQFDPKSFKQLESIIKEYPATIEKIDSKNKIKNIKVSPFELYRQNHGYVRKYSKHHNGPIIRQLKYYDKKLGKNIDVTPKYTKNKKVVLQSLNPWRTDVYYNPESQNYEIMGIKYSDLTFIKGNNKYGIKLDKYLEIKKQEKISDKSKFKFSLFRKNRIKVENIKDDKSIEMLFWSKSASYKGYAELKPIDSYSNLREEWPIYGKAKKQIIKPLIPKNCKIWKVNTDILGNPYYVSQEGNFPKNIID